MHTVGRKTASCVSGPMRPSRLLGGVGRTVRRRGAPTRDKGRGGTTRATRNFLRKRDRRTQGLCGCMKLMTPARVSMLVGKTDKAKGRCITRHVRRLDGHSRGPFVTVSYNSVPGSLTTSRFFNRIGNSFANTLGSGTNTFRRTGKNALFLSRVKGLDCRIRMRLLHTLRRHHVHQVNSAGRVRISIHLVDTAGRGLGRTVTGKGFQRSLCRHVGRFALRVPSLGRHPRSVLLFTGFFLSRTGRRLRHALVKFSTRTDRTVRGCP